MGVQFPQLSGRGYEGPDLNLAPMIEAAIAELDSALVADHRDDATRDMVADHYLDAWQRIAGSYGVSAQLMWEKVFPVLMVGQTIDSQHEERARRCSILWDHLLRSGYRFQLLARLVRELGDGSGTNPKSTPDEVAHWTIDAMRRFLETDGRILIDAHGNLTEGGGMPRRWGKSADFHASIMDAGRDYFSAIACPHPAAQIKAFVEQFGQRHANGWIELTAQAPIFTDPEVAFAAWRAAYARIDPSGDANSEGVNDDPDWAIIGLAEDAILNTMAASARLAELRLWVGLAHAGISRADLGRAVQRADLTAIIAAGAADFDWPAWPMISAISALREVARG